MQEREAAATSTAPGSLLLYGYDNLWFFRHTYFLYSIIFFFGSVQHHSDEFNAPRDELRCADGPEP